MMVMTSMLVMIILTKSVTSHLSWWQGGESSAWVETTTIITLCHRCHYDDDDDHDDHHDDDDHDDHLHVHHYDKG